MHILIVNFVNIEQVLLCKLYNSFAIFDFFLHFAR